MIVVGTGLPNCACPLACCKTQGWRQKNDVHTTVQVPYGEQLSPTEDEESSLLLVKCYNAIVGMVQTHLLPELNKRNVDGTLPWHLQQVQSRLYALSWVSIHCNYANQQCPQVIKPLPSLRKCACGDRLCRTAWNVKLSKSTMCSSSRFLKVICG